MRKWAFGFVLLLGLLGITGMVNAEVIYTLDFSKGKAGDAKNWLKSNGFTFEQDADDDDMILRFEKGKLIIGTRDDINGGLIKDVNINGAKRIRIEWGVTQYPQGADWEKGVFREAVAIWVMFGTEKISSGSFVVPNLPYFIGIFLGELEKEGKAYLGNYYKKGGRYFCSPCGRPVGESIITEFEIYKTFLEQFDEKSVPPISAVVIEADTRDTKGKSMAFIKKIEFLSD